MAKLELSRRVNAPRDRVFEVFTDLSRAAERISGIRRLEILTDGPVGKGTRFRETRVMFGREATETFEFTDFQPGRLYTVCANSCGAIFESTFTFTPEGSATQVVMTMQTKPVTLLAKVATLFSFLCAGMMKRIMTQDLDDLARVAESGN
jgi:uncharacterized protein YndB with AHSA1/START domain